MTDDRNRKAEWNYTMFGEEFRSKKEFSSTEYHFVSRDTAVNLSIHHVPGIREAIMVDGEKDQILKSSYDEFEKQLKQKLIDNFGSLAVARQESDRKNFESDVLQSVFDYVRSKMKYSLDQVDRINQRNKDPNSKSGHDPIFFGAYIAEGFGVCRHQALFCCFIIEKLIEAGVLKGKVSFDRNELKKKDGVIGGHGWARYTSLDAQVVILDAAQNVVKNIDKTRDDQHWQYERPFENQITIAGKGETQAYYRFPGSQRVIFLLNQNTGSYYISDVNSSSRDINIIQDNQVISLEKAVKLKAGTVLRVPDQGGYVEYMVKIDGEKTMLQMKTQSTKIERLVANIKKIFQTK